MRSCTPYFGPRNFAQVVALLDGPDNAGDAERPTDTDIAQTTRPLGRPGSGLAQSLPNSVVYGVVLRISQLDSTDRQRNNNHQQR